MKPEILYEDNHLIAVNKPNNIPVQRDSSGDKALVDYVKEYIKEKYNKPGEVYLGLIHRIDRPVSGLVLLAKTSKALTRMHEQFRENKVTKTYWAVVKDYPGKQGDRLVHYLRRDTKKNKSFCYTKKVPDGKLSELSYEVKAKSDHYYLLEVDLITGRHHQIRAQLAVIGSPVKGDLKYNARRSNPDGGIDLHSRSMQFIHPVRKEPVSITAPVPDQRLWHDMEAML